MFNAKEALKISKDNNIRLRGEDEVFRDILTKVRNAADHGKTELIYGYIPKEMRDLVIDRLDRLNYRAGYSEGFAGCRGLYMYWNYVV